MSLGLTAVLKTLLLPPTINFILIACGFLIQKKIVWLGRLCWIAGLLFFVVISFRPVSYTLVHSLESYPPLSVPLVTGNEKAIVVLGAGINGYASEFGRATESVTGLQRLQYAAFLHQQSGLPVLLSGGVVNQHRISEAAVMAATLKNSFNVGLLWQEQLSRNTWENASYTATLLNGQGIKSIFLVTHAHHISRAVMAFEAHGIEATPAPLGFVTPPRYDSVVTYLPSMGAMLESHSALHEYLGLLWYRLRYRSSFQ